MDQRVLELGERMAAHIAGEPFPIQEYHDEVVRLHLEVEDEASRVQCLVLSTALANVAEMHLEDQGIDLAEFRHTRISEYRTMLAFEALDEDGEFDPDNLARIVEREVEARRLHAEDPFRLFALTEAKSASREH